jgi:hypothetical protein
MKLREIAKARTTLQNAGTTADRNQLRKTLLSHLAKDVETLRQHMATVRSDYRRKLERWRTEVVPENVTVCALPSDMHDSRLYRATGVFALLCEMALAAWMFQWLGVGWWMGVATALGITLTLHGIFLHVFDNPERPKEAIYRLRTRVSLPAIFGFLVALAMGMLARYVNGPLAVLLLPAFSFALWVGTLSLLILAASLFTVAHIQGWSARHEKQYRKLGNEERETSAFQSELQSEEVRTEEDVEHPPFAAATSSTFSSTAAGRAMGFLFAGMLALSLVSGSGCATPMKSANAPETAVVSETNSAALHAFVDTSGSCVRPALAEAWNTVRRELPEVVEKRGITQLNVWQFDEDGWSPRRLHEIPLPTMQTSAHRQVPGTEWASFANIRDAVHDAEEQELRAQTVATQQNYRNQLRSALKELDADHVLAEAKSTARSDIIGLLRRVSQASEFAPQYVLILTDLADTRYRNFPKLPPPQSNVRVLVLLVPAQAKDARMTLGKAHTGPEQFDIRARQLREAAPWITVAPYFAHNLPELLGSLQTP